MASTKPDARASPATNGGRQIMKYGILWLLGIPIPVLIILYLVFH